MVPGVGSLGRPPASGCRSRGAFSFLEGLEYGKNARRLRLTRRNRPRARGGIAIPTGA